MFAALTTVLILANAPGIQSWSYAAAPSVTSAAAELRIDDSLVFRVTCPRKGELRFDYHFDPRQVSSDAVRSAGLSVVYWRRGEDEGHTMKAVVRGSVATGRLKLTPQISWEIAREPYLFLYGENGPGNLWGDGGEAVALRRLAKACSPR